MSVENGSLNAMSGRGNLVSFFEKKSVELMVAVMTLQQQWGEYEDMKQRQEVRVDEVRLPVQVAASILTCWERPPFRVR